MKRKFLPIFVSICVLGFATILDASPVRISFLDNEVALKRTTDFLAAKGCDSNSISLFRTVVSWYNNLPLGFDLKEFPKNENGFFSFQSVSNLVEALPQPIINANHAQQLDCFDNAILLAGNLTQTCLQPDALSGPFLVPVPMTNGVVTMAVEETARDAFDVAYPPWYIERTKAVFGESLQGKRICLTAAFDSYCVLPSSTTLDNLANSLLKTLQSGWKRQGIVFPTNMEIVICHSVVLNEHFVPLQPSFANATHAGLLVQDHGQYTYIEKAGTRGPYVRLDFTVRKDLLPWLKSVIQSTTDERDHLFATFNDQEIESLDDISH